MRTAAAATAVEGDRIFSVPVRERRGHAFFIRMGLQQRAILLLQVTVPPFRILAKQFHRLQWMFLCRLLQ